MRVQFDLNSSILRTVNRLGSITSVNYLVRLPGSTTWFDYLVRLYCSTTRPTALFL